VDKISLVAAFAAGLFSFFSPCVLPLVPAYLSFIAGISAEEMGEEKIPRELLLHVLKASLFFVLGFSVIFILLGASATTIGKFLLSRLEIFSKLAGIVVILFGLHLTGVIRLNPLNYEKRLHIQRKPVGAIGAFGVGMAFAIGWTPCIGPILGGILAYASTQETIWYGMLLLACYSLGFGLPFLLAGIGIKSFLVWAKKLRPYMRYIEIASGVLLIIWGALMLTDNFQQLANWLSIALGGV